MRYFYSIARFVPDPANGECINLGILAGSDESRDWSMRTLESRKRASAIDTHDVLPEVVGQLARLEARVLRFMVAQDDTPLLNPEEVSLRWLRQLVHDYGNVLQLSEPLPVIADSAEDAIDALWAQLVFEPATKELRYLRKTSAKAVFRYALTHRGIPATNVAESVRIRGRDHSSTMDFVIHNGMASDLTHCWSFQLPGKRALLEEIKAWAWTIHDIREHGGMTVGAGEDDLSIPSEVPIHVVYVPPTETNDATLDEALSAFQELRVTATSMRDFDSIVANIEPPVT